MKQRYHHDHWTLHDHFGIGRVGDQLARLLLEVPPPFAVRVTGKWGSGKTSVLKRAFATLGGSPVSQTMPLGPEKGEDETWRKYIADGQYKQLCEEWGIKYDPELFKRARQSPCVWFSPWQHQSADFPLIPLLLEIRNQFTAWTKTKTRVSENWRPFALATATLLERGIDMALTLKNTRTTKVASGTTNAVTEAWQQGASKLLDLSDGQRFHLLFEDAVSQLLEGHYRATKKRGEKAIEDRRLIIFIDDLDRCEETVVKDLLEFIKLYLSTHNCVFVFGIDDTAVLNALSRVWDGRSEVENREYLEKLFQATVPVPKPGHSEVCRFLIDQLEAHDFGDHSKQLAVFLERLLEPNPRKIKNFTNSLCATWALTPKTDNLIFCVQFLVCHYLRLFHAPVWRLVERVPELWPMVHDMLANQNLRSVSSGVLSTPQQDLVKIMLERRFAHVFKNTTRSDSETTEMYLNMTMDQAVDHMLENIDQKRSDEQLRILLKEFFPENEPLNPILVNLRPPLEPEDAP
ncbi:MAG: P-loop NTPase fold protein [Acidobacteriota bacterium]|nr:P-loop NTPase fold protein [Acidobacteriota bacterium]